jgi:hypothetical protein
VCTSIRTRQDPAEEAEDSALITKVKTALATDGVANGHPVEIDCDHGVARLSGVVASADDAKHAARVAAAVPGVTGVDKKLTGDDLIIRNRKGRGSFQMLDPSRPYFVRTHLRFRSRGGR